MANGRYLDKNKSKSKRNAVWDKFIIPLIVGLCVTILGGLLQDYITPDHNSSSDDSSHNSPGNNINLNDSSNKGSENRITLDDFTHTGTVDNVSSNETISNGSENKITLDGLTHTGAVDNVSLNGTMPRGTAPQDISISEEMKEILVSIQKLSTGSSKDWIDNKLGPPLHQMSLR